MITPTASSETGIAILIIEDNLGDQLLLETHLESTGLSIATINIASTIAEGITLLQNNIFSLIFLDFFLPDSNGLDSYLELAKINSRVPVVILSGLSDTALSIKAISLGAQDFLLKGGYTTESLEKCVSYSIERKRNLVLLKENNERYDEWVNEQCAIATKLYQLNGVKEVAKEVPLLKEVELLTNHHLQAPQPFINCALYAQGRIYSKVCRLLLSGRPAGNRR